MVRQLDREPGEIEPSKALVRHDDYAWLRRGAGRAIRPRTSSSPPPPAIPRQTPGIAEPSGALDARSYRVRPPRRRSSTRNQRSGSAPRRLAHWAASAARTVPDRGCASVCRARLAALDVSAHPGPLRQQIAGIGPRQHARADHIGDRELAAKQPLALAQRRLDRVRGVANRSRSGDSLAPRLRSRIQRYSGPSSSVIPNTTHW